MIRSGTRAIEIGIALPHARGAAMARFAQRAEALGFDRVVAGGGPDADALVTLGYVAAATYGIRLACAGLSLPGRSAALVARAARSLDDLSEGRFALWVTAEAEQPPLGLTTGAGRPFDAALAELASGPAAAVPRLVVVRDRRGLERAGRHADGVVLGPDAGPYDVAGAVTELAALWRDRDRGGRPQVVARIEVGALLELEGRVAELVAAGATGVVLRPAADVTPEELAGVLGLGVPRPRTDPT